MSSKGISPLIAAVLLIAFTMAVASIFAQWAPQLMQDAQGDSRETAQTIQDCSDRTLEVSSQDGDNVTIQQIGGNDGIGNLTLTFFYETGNPEQTSTDSSSDIETSRGITTIENPNSTKTVTKVEVEPIDCEGAPSARWEP